ncbi:MAG: hypothetical protein HC927_09800 [Deltaproteobacteria bacterium]|nr:hypothetical protein [Deltaproteobacteria bacterium]
MQATESTSPSTSDPMRLPPGPSGQVVSTLRLIRQPLEALREWHEIYGDTFTVKKLGVPTVITADPDLIGQIYAVRDLELFDAVLFPAADALFGPRSRR